MVTTDRHLYEGDDCHRNTRHAPRALAGAARGPSEQRSQGAHSAPPPARRGAKGSPQASAAGLGAAGPV